MQYYINVVNHEIQDDIHIQSPFIEQSKPIGFYKHRFREMWVNGTKGRIETLEKSHLENAAFTISQSNQVLCLVKALGHGLFQEHVNTCIQEVPSNCIVGWCGCSDAHRINASDKILMIDNKSFLKLSGHHSCTVLIEIGNCNEIRFRKPCIFLRVKTTKIADPHYANPYGVR